jgi:murein L,D-transpeptidase YafK
MKIRRIIVVLAIVVSFFSSAADAVDEKTQKVAKSKEREAVVGQHKSREHKHRETKRQEIKRQEIKRQETKRQETKRQETKRQEIKKPVESTIIAAKQSVPKAVSARQDNVVPGNIFVSGRSNITALLVDKSTENLYVVKAGEGSPSIARSFKISTGKNSGDKVTEGDRKTPEGIYFTTGVIPKKKLNVGVFGSGAFPLDYPNLFDKLKGKTGHGIWIHGKGDDRDDPRTKGCVALNNGDLDHLKPFIKESGGTPVVIARKLDFLKPEDYKAQKTKHMAYLEGFIATWESGDIDKFSKYFGPEFKDSAGHSISSYLQKKKKLSEKYERKKITIADVTVFKENSDELVYRFSQMYCADNVLSYGTKVLFLSTDKSKDGYKVVAEDFYRGDPQPEVVRTVNDMLKDWRESWQSKDMDAYLAFYDESFSDGRRNLTQWKAYKEEVAKSSTTIGVNMSDIKIKPVSNMEVTVTFVQDYKSNKVSDRGLKTITLKGCPGDYKIASEMWSKL